MTISTTVRSVDFSGNGSTTAFNIGFPWQQDADLVVTLIDNTTSGETSWALGVDYTLSGGDPSGTLTATVAPASGYTLHVERVVAYVQTLDLIDNDGFDAEANEATLDRIVQMIQQIADEGGGGAGGTVTLANVGTGEGVSAGLTGATYGLKSLKASGTGLSVADDADSITYTLAGALLAANNLSDVASQQTSLNTLTAVGAATNEHVLTKDTGTGNATWKVVPTGGAGEANTMSSSGGTHSIVLAKAGVNLPVKGFTAGTNVTITPSGTDLTIAATGEANDIISKAGTGLSIIYATSKSGVNLQTKGVGVGTGLSISSSATDLTLSINQAATLAWTGQHTFTRNATSGSPNVQINSLNNGAMSVTGVTITSDYLAAADVRKTSDLATYDTTYDAGGSFAFYAQHVATGAATYAGPYPAMLHGAYRGAVSLNASSGTYNSDGVAFYAGVENLGSRPQVLYGHYADVFVNNSNSSSAGYGFAAELFVSNSAPRADAYVAKVMASPGGLDADAAFLIRRDSGAQKFAVGFSVGATGIAGAADVGFDTTYGTIGTAAFRMAGGQLFRLDGGASTADMRYSSGDTAIQFLSSGDKTFGVENTGIPVFYETSGTIVGAAGGASPLPATPVRYINVRYNTGTLAAPVIATGKIAIFSF